MSEVHTIASLFFSRNDVQGRVYCHRVIQALHCMTVDILERASLLLNLSRAFDEMEEFFKLDDRLLYLIENGEGAKLPKSG